MDAIDGQIGYFGPPPPPDYRLEPGDLVTVVGPDRTAHLCLVMDKRVADDGSSYEFNLLPDPEDC